MFSVPHFIWLAISIASIVLVLRWLLAQRLPLRQVLTGACVVAACSEVVKVLTHIQMVPSADGTAMHLFMEWRHLPLHLCSIQIFFIFYARLAADSRGRDAILAFMYPTCIMGAALALLMPSIFTQDVTPAQAFTSPICYQFFTYHSMLVVLGIYIARCQEVPIRFAHLRSSLAILFGLGVMSIYLNSAFAAVSYSGTELLSVENTPNFFFTFRTPIGIPLTTMWHWYLYLAIVSAIAVVSMTLFYLPYRTAGRA